MHKVLPSRLRKELCEMQEIAVQGIFSLSQTLNSGILFLSLLSLLLKILCNLRCLFMEVPTHMESPAPVDAFLFYCLNYTPLLLFFKVLALSL